MATCPAGHSSGSADYCDVCGELIGAASAPGPAAAGAASPAGGDPCPDCGTPANDRFCEECGYDFATGGGKPTAGPRPGLSPQQPPPPQAPAPSAGTAWVAVVNADRDYFERVLTELGDEAGGIAFPPYSPERRIPLTSGQVRIGRRSSSRSLVPEIDLREPPEDPGVSHVHAVLLARPSGDWTLVDPGSRNRTCLNGAADPIALNVEVPVGDGDRIHVGAWTTITLRRDEAT